MIQERPEVFRKIHKFVVPGGYVAGRMAGLKGDTFIDYTYIPFSSFSNIVEATWDVNGFTWAHRKPHFYRAMLEWRVVPGSCTKSILDYNTFVILEL